MPVTFTFADLQWSGPWIDTTTIPNSSGLYTVWVRASSEDGWRLIDVGESEHLGDSLRWHERTECWLSAAGEKQTFFAVSLTPTWTRQQRRNYEEEIRSKYQPPCGR